MKTILNRMKDKSRNHSPDPAANRIRTCVTLTGVPFNSC